MSGIALDDFRRLGGDLLLFLVLVALAVTGAGLMADSVRQAKRALTATATAQREIADKVSRIREEELWWRESIARFQQLSARGILGRERPLDWVEELRALSQEHSLIGLEYELGPPHALPDDAFPASGYQALSSPMKLRIRPRHEGELLDFLDALRDQASALLRVRRCVLERSRAPTPDQTPPATLEANCELEWITLGEKRP
ncbi:hypothetical protein [Denitratisoma oestradiolicum]|uniref:Uncharacterized protein n=1 Tax=Denitratisoma oestradiolicum TaxID=311182 RepID=A0A6S6XV41_9PROT|nr:hypothetical protein [Denitratisoma oestradiolicum]TWO79094.1 hypothetical protein CBW56_16610 [Denitratisoma oestradiolicum]CAB1369914.1 conserved protein of unknown function [Denitratisoma oestradiolicum]